MSTVSLPALDWAAPIVDIKTGRPTPYLQRFWQNLKVTAVDGANQSGDIAALQASVTTINGQITGLTASKAPLANPAFTGNPTAPTPGAGDNDTSLATTAFVQGEIATKAPLASAALTGTPTAPTAAGGTNTTQLSTTAFVQTAVSSKAPLASPALTGSPTAPTAAQGTNTTQLASTAFVHTEAVARATFATWVSATGTAERTTFATYTAPTASAAYSQSDTQAMMDALQNVARRVKALIDDLKS